MHFGPIDWGAYGGEFVERVMATLLAQDFPALIQREPSGGDGGVDLLIPDGQRFEVFQVKGFTKRLAASQKRQISNSYKELKKGPRLPEKSISAVRFVIPTNPTSAEQKWCADLVEGAPWPVEFRWRPYCDVLAANHQRVIDFFTRGNDKAERRYEALLEMTGDLAAPLTPEVLTRRLSKMMMVLNQEDPHYRYDLSTSLTPELGSKARETYVLTQQREVPGLGWVSVLVSPKHRQSGNWSPIRGKVTVTSRDGANASALHEVFEAFESFGRALEVTDSLVRFELDAPGGLGGTFEGSGFSIGPMEIVEELQPVRLVVISDAGEVLSEVVLQNRGGTRGSRGGAEVLLSDELNLVRCTARFSPPEGDRRAGSFNFQFGGALGKPAVAVLPVARFISHLRPPHRLQVRYEHGKTVLGELAISEDHDWIDASALSHLEDLALLQDFADRPLLISDESEPGFARELHEYARMLRGEEIRALWDDLTFNLHVSRDALDLNTAIGRGGVVTMERNVLLEYGGQELDLGPFTWVVQDVLVADDQPLDPMVIRFVPGANNTLTRRTGTVTDLPQEE